MAKNQDWRAVQRRVLFRSRRELSNEYLLAKFGFDTAENEPCKVCPLSAYRSPVRLIIIITDPHSSGQITTRGEGGSFFLASYLPNLPNILQNHDILIDYFSTLDDDTIQEYEDYMFPIMEALEINSQELEGDISTYRDSDYAECVDHVVN